MKKFKQIIYLLSKNEKKSAVQLFLMILIMATLDVAGVASILPFVAVLSNPAAIETSNFISSLYNFSNNFGINSNTEFLFFLGIIFFLLLLLSLSFKAFTIYVQLRFITMREYSLSRNLIEGYVRQPYSWFLNRNSAELGKNILTEVDFVVSQGLKSLIDLISYGVLTIFLLIVLILIKPMLTIMIGITFIFAYGAIFSLTGKFLKRIGKERGIANRKRFSLVNEVFGGIKELKVSGLEESYASRFEEPAKIFASHKASSHVLALIPRYAIEAFVFGGLILVIIFYVLKIGSFNDIVPTVALYAFVGYRLMPSLQQVYAAISRLRFVGPELEKIFDDFKIIKSNSIKSDKYNLTFKKEVNLKGLIYNYPNSKLSALKNIKLNIVKNKKIGIVGKTGSGKTTLVDIILGLLEPQQGTVEVDGVVLNRDNIRSWQRSLGYIPQDVYLADDTIANNIAFGVDPINIDKDMVIYCAKVANIHEFIINELPLGYETMSGENGVRLSGGQCQRIAIARALYNKPKILILDEATSALDNETEKIVMEALENLSKDITLIMIAHRMSTVRNCDKIFLLEKGTIKAEGSYDELIVSSQKFKAFTEIN